MLWLSRVSSSKSFHLTPPPLPRILYLYFERTAMTQKGLNMMQWRFHGLIARDAMLLILLLIPAAARHLPLVRASAKPTDDLLRVEGSNDRRPGGLRSTVPLSTTTEQHRRQLQSVVHTVPFDIGAINYSDFFDTTDSHTGNCGAGPVDSKKYYDDICVARGGTCTVAWTARNEWLRYDVDVPVAGTVNITVRLSSKRSTKQLAVDLDTTEVAVWYAPGRGWAEFEDRVVENVALSQGSHQLFLRFVNGQMNVCSVTVEYASQQTPTTETPTLSPRTTETPTVSPPTTEAPTTSTPVTSSPTTEAPNTAAPSTSSPVLSTPTTSEAPTTAVPVISSPTTTEAPMMLSSEAPVTTFPTNSAPVTTSPMTTAPTISPPTTSAPIITPPTNDTFRIKMYHEPGYFWQCDGVCDTFDPTVDVDPMWCLQCDGTTCQENEYAKLQTCDTAGTSLNTLFEFVPTGTAGEVMIREANSNVCLSTDNYADTTYRMNTLMKTCGSVDSVEQTYSTAGFGDFDSENFEIHPQGGTKYCLTTQHHPLNDEDARVERCGWARNDKSNWWMKYNPS